MFVFCPAAAAMATVEGPVAAASRKRRPKAQYVQAAKRARAGAARQLEAGMCGILITCNMNERKCVAEAYSLLGEYGEQLYGPEQVSGGPAKGRPHPEASRKSYGIHCSGAWRLSSHRA